MIWRRLKVKPRPWQIALAVVLLLGSCCGGGAVYAKQWPAQCRRDEAAEAARVHTERGPIAEELAPLGPILDVHWVQEVEPTRCEWIPTPGRLEYDRVGVVRLRPADAARIIDQHPYTGTIYIPSEVPDPDPRMSPWLPPNPDWHYSPPLDDSFQPRGDFGEVEYAVDPNSGTVAFSSYVDYDAAQSSRHG